MQTAIAQTSGKKMHGGPVSQAVAGRIRAELAYQRKTGADLARYLGLKQAALSRRITGYTPIDVDELVGIATFLDVDVAELLTDDVRSVVA